MTILKMNKINQFPIIIILFSQCIYCFALPKDYAASIDNEKHFEKDEIESPELPPWLVIAQLVTDKLENLELALKNLKDLGVVDSGVLHEVYNIVNSKSYSECSSRALDEICPHKSTMKETVNETLAVKHLPESENTNEAPPKNETAPTPVLTQSLKPNSVLNLSVEETLKHKIGIDDTSAIELKMAQVTEQIRKLFDKIKSRKKQNIH